MKILKIISLLMDYPRAELQSHNRDLEDEINSCSDVSATDKNNLVTLLHYFRNQDLMDVQENYESLFERGRAVSLLLFEHVHGESRDRGQAMVDLMNHYEQSGFEIKVRELPDYLPLYLEFLSTRSKQEIINGIDDVAHIIAILAERLKQRGSIYHHCFDVLLNLANVSVDSEHLQSMVSNEERDDTLEAIDKVWEEEMVTFATTDPETSCPTKPPPPSGKPAETSTPVHWVDNKTSTQKKSITN